MISIDLNADLGEGSGPEVEEGLLDVVTSASIACGFHAGDPVTMHAAVEAAVLRGVVVGAHPSYDDRDGFGRTERDVEPARVADDLLYQVGALEGLARSCGARVSYVKPHGALYNRMAVEESTARAVCEAVRDYGGLVLLAPAGSVAETLANEMGVRVAAEVFADRAYTPAGTLVARTLPGAVLHDPEEVARRSVTLATAHEVETVEGDRISLQGASICIHSDTPRAPLLAARVRAALEAAGVGLVAFAS